MATGCAECRLAGFLLTRMLIQIAELLFHVWILYFLYTSGSLICFAVCTSVITLSTLGSQLVSFETRRRENAEKAPSCSFIVCHVMLVGLFWRYYRLLRCCHLPITRQEMWQCFVVNVFDVFTRSFPMLLVTVYLIMNGDFIITDLCTHWYLIAGAVTSFIAIIQSLVVYKKRRHICCVVGAVTPSSGLLWNIPWRVGEVLARVFPAVMFATVHGYWILLVVGLHWITVTSLLVIDHIRIKENGVRALRDLFVSSYVHVFVSFNVASRKSRMVAILYFVLNCAESLTLTTLWLLYESRKELRVPVSAVIACCQVSAVVCATGYYNFLFRKPEATGNDNDVIYFQCVTCRTLDKVESRFCYQTHHMTTPEVSSPPFCDQLLTSEFRECAANKDSQERKCINDRNDVIVTSHDFPIRHLKRLPSTCARPACGSCMCVPDSGDTCNQSGTVHGDPDLSWDNYDINNYSDTTDYSEIQRPNYDRLNPDLAISLAKQTCAASALKHADPGYFSGISSSSKEVEANPERSRILNSVPPRRRIPLFPNTCDGLLERRGIVDDHLDLVTGLLRPFQQS
ncbi:hypothetical protein LSH36_173g05062 [Paralvinella palmiformis]|uniref:XK-related protein n=1 Tax=Paralvinella palmiformis TaxID=53620 RepID=A0AAD9JTK3_9ANNE|nr:hypothetical protein LSH36_173g05062 [Paralvinella palmiformis]